MKLMLGFTVLLALFFLQTFDTYAHLACQSERDKVATAERNLNLAQRDVRAQGLQIDEMWLTEFAEYPSSPDFNARLKAAEDQLKAYEKTRDAAQTKVNNARAARDRCIANDTRDCPGSCSKLHTPNVTSCECNCASWMSESLSGCECAGCSRYLNRN